ncbi:MAG: NAD(P)-binding protein, partial [Opitutaceae bacterium]|nr:NAD(P)-binding protein [Cytophagales bacterium]
MSPQNIAVIGAGISGISISKMLTEEGKNVTLFERNDEIGGLVKCNRIQDNLFHLVGGHVFNSKNPEVLDWFWKYFDKDREFLVAKRNAKIYLDDRFVGYPIEDHLYELPPITVAKIIQELLEPILDPEINNFEQFLLKRFGPTLYKLYFKPYNSKLWNCDLSLVPIDWLNGKLPMPDNKEIILNNIFRRQDVSMVHSNFYYPKEDGSQFIVNRLSEGLDIEFNSQINSLTFNSGKWILNGGKEFDSIVYCGDIRELNKICFLDSVSVELNSLNELRSNGSSNLFCESDPTDISWMYIPEEKFKAHRIIYTGNFSDTNNRGSDRITCVVEFPGIQELELMSEEIKKLPGNLKV